MSLKEEYFTPTDLEWQAVMDQWRIAEACGIDAEFRGIKGEIVHESKDPLEGRRTKHLTTIATPNPALAEEIAKSDRNKVPLLRSASYVQSSDKRVLITQDLRFNRSIVTDPDTGEEHEGYESLRVEFRGPNASIKIGYYGKQLLELTETCKGGEIVPSPTVSGDFGSVAAAVNNVYSHYKLTPGVVVNEVVYTRLSA